MPKISPLFDEVERQGRRQRRDLNKLTTAVALCQAAARRKPEIDEFRRTRQIMREKGFQNGNRNGHLITGEMHPLEYEACKFLCPDLNIKNGQPKTKNWYWIIRQEWGKDLAAAPIERTRF